MQEQIQERLIDYSEAMKICGLKSRSTLYEWVQAGKFPAPVKLGTGPKAPVKFKLSQVMAYIESLPAQNY